MRIRNCNWMQIEQHADRSLRRMHPSLVRGLVALVACSAASARADSFTSSASSAGSASSGSVSTSLRGSSDSSTSGRRDRNTAYRIVEIAGAERAGDARLVLQADDPSQRLWLDLPRGLLEREALLVGDVVEARERVYGWAFARGGATDAFFLVLTDAWSRQVAARLVTS